VLGFADHQTLTLADALTELAMDRSTFYRYCEKGRLRKFVHAGHVYVPRQSIEDYKESLNSKACQEQARNARSARARRAS
jgi:predicted DNA-binding transcriptional regulator AlpA